MIFSAGSGIFYNTIGGLSDKYPLDITPSGWAFSIWGIIYLWLGISIVFSKSSLLQNNFIKCNATNFFLYFFFSCFYNFQKRFR